MTRIDPTLVYASLEVSSDSDQTLHFCTKDGRPAALLDDGEWYAGEYDETTPVSEDMMGLPIEEGDDGTWLEVRYDDLDPYIREMDPSAYDDDGTFLGADSDVMEQAFKAAANELLQLCCQRVTDSDDDRYEYRVESL